MVYLLLVPQIVLLGPPASGKRTIAKSICNKLRTAHITAENLVAEAEVELRNEAQAYLNKGQVKKTLKYI